jgi:hypothetical protein
MTLSEIRKRLQALENPQIPVAQVGDPAVFPITNNFLKQMNEHYFGFVCTSDYLVTNTPPVV